VGVPAKNIGLIGFPGAVHLGVRVTNGMNMNMNILRYFNLFHVTESDGNTLPPPLPLPLDLATVESSLQMPVILRDSNTSTTFMTYAEIGRRCINNVLSSETKRTSESCRHVETTLKEVIGVIFLHEYKMLMAMETAFNRVSLRNSVPY